MICILIALLLPTLANLRITLKFRTSFWLVYKRSQSHPSYRKCIHTSSLCCSTLVLSCITCSRGRGWGTGREEEGVEGGFLMSRPLMSKLLLRYLSDRMPQESWNNVVPQQQRMECVCVCMGGGVWEGRKSVSGLPSFNNAAAPQSVLLWRGYCSHSLNSVHRRRLGRGGV